MTFVRTPATPRKPFGSAPSSLGPPFPPFDLPANQESFHFYGSAQECVEPRANRQLPHDRLAAGRLRFPVKGRRPPVESELGPLTEAFHARKHSPTVPWKRLRLYPSRA